MSFIRNSAEGEENNNPLLRRYMPELDTLRGIAILLVLCLHGIHDPLLLALHRLNGRSAEATLSNTGTFLLWLTRFGWTGVNLFFVLSGFLITGILLDARKSADYFSRFYKRRALRILPPLYATLLVLQLGSWVSWRFTALAALFFANCAPLFSLPLQYPPLWSLAVEEHFYLLWPAVVRRFSSRTLILTLLAVCAGTPFLRIYFLIGHPVADLNFTWFNLDGLALGALLAIWLRSQSFQRRNLVAFSIAALLLGCAGFIIAARYEFVLQETMCDLASAGLLSGMLLLGTSSWRSLVDRPFLRLVGYVSYGLYLIHLLIFKGSVALLWPVSGRLQPLLGPTGIVLLQFLLGSALAILVAFLSRRSLEEFFLQRGKSSRTTALPESGIPQPV